MLAGLHNFLAVSPGGPDYPKGASFGSINVQANGSAAVVVHGAEGTTFACTSPVGVNGESIVYQCAYAVKGTMLGSFTIANDVVHTVAGSIGWTRPIQSGGGWTNELTLGAVGGKYRPVSGSTIVMDLPTKSPSNGDMLLQDGGVSPAIHVPFSVAAPASVTVPAGTKLTFTVSTGAFSGSYNYGGLILPFQGLIIPKTDTANLYDGRGLGYFLTPGTDSVVIRSGMVTLSAAP